MRSDVVVIGGGAIGAAVAYFVRLLDPGTEVLVVERDPGYSLASTLRASGGVRRLFSLPENIALSKCSIGFFEDFATRWPSTTNQPTSASRRTTYSTNLNASLLMMAEKVSARVNLRTWATALPMSAVAGHQAGLLSHECAVGWPTPSQSTCCHVARC